MNSDPITVRALDASLSNLQRALVAYHDGDPYAHHPVAVELRKLLCDNRGERDQSLLLRRFPLVALHPLRNSSLPIDRPEVVFAFNGRLSVGASPQGNVTRVFDERGAGLPLVAWREQMLLNERITIRELIRSVADKEAAHVDPKRNTTLDLTQATYFGSATADGEMIVAIGDYFLAYWVARELQYVIHTRQEQYAREFEQGNGGALHFDMRRPVLLFSKGLDVPFMPTAELVDLVSNASENELARQYLQGHSPQEGVLLWTTSPKGAHSLKLLVPRKL